MVSRRSMRPLNSVYDVIVSIKTENALCCLFALIVVEYSAGTTKNQMVFFRELFFCYKKDMRARFSLKFCLQFYKKSDILRR